MGGALSTLIAAADAGSAAAPGPVSDPASLVNPFIGTSGSVDTFPGPDMPFGMLQWSPDTAPNRPRGGGYEYNDSSISGFSLTHLSGPGCAAYGDVPILPTVGDIGSSPAAATATFSHMTESAQAGYYSVTLGDGVTVNLTDAMRSGIATFGFPPTTQANLLFKLTGSQDSVDGTSARIVGDSEVTGSVTAGHFCRAPSARERDYTLHFDIRFDHRFTAGGTWCGGAMSAVTPGATSPAPQAASPAPQPTVPTPPATHGVMPRTASSVINPAGVYVTFDTTASQTVTAKVGISFTSAADASANLDTEIPGWNFGQVRQANHEAWNDILGRIQIDGGSPTRAAATCGQGSPTVAGLAASRQAHAPASSRARRRSTRRWCRSISRP
jgi:putative alpha-1,2-mannosidase